MTLGMNLGSLQKIIKCANNDDNCKLSASEDADTLNLQFQGKRESALIGPDLDIADKHIDDRHCFRLCIATPSAGAARIGEYEMKLMDIDSEQLGIPETDYDAKIRMPSSEFAKIMRDLKDLGESVRIEATSEGVKFTAEGEIGSGSVTIKPTGEWEEPETKSKKRKATTSASSKKVKKERAGSARVKNEENGDESDENMDEEEEEDVKPKVKKEEPTSDNEDDEEEEDSDEEEGSDDDEEEESSKKKKAAASKAKKGKKPADGEDARNVFIDVSQAVSLNFSIKYLNNFAKSTPLSNEVILQMSNDVPLLVGPKSQTVIVPSC